MTVNQAFLRLVFFRSLWLAGLCSATWMAYFVAGSFPIGRLWLAIASGLAILFAGWILPLLPLVLVDREFLRGVTGEKLSWRAYLKTSRLIIARGPNRILLCTAILGLLVIVALPREQWRFALTAIVIFWLLLVAADFMMLPRRSFRIALGGLLALLLPLLLPVGVLAYLEHEITRCYNNLDALDAKQPRYPEDLRKRYAEVSPNAASLHREMLQSPVELPPELGAYAAAIYPVKNPPRAALQKYLEDHRDYFDRLDRAAAIPTARFGWSYREPVDDLTLSTHFRQSIRNSGYRQVADPAKADRHWLQSAALIDHTEDQANVIGFLFASAMESTRLKQLETRMLFEKPPPPETLRRMIAQLSDREKFFQHLIVSSIEGEQVHLWQMFRTSEALSLSYGTAAARQIASIFPFDRLMEAYSLKAFSELKHQAVAEVSGEPYPGDTVMRRKIEELPVIACISKMLAEPTFIIIPQRYFSLIARLRCARVALALELFRQENGRYPAKLAELMPKYLAQVPLNPFDGKEPVWKIAETEITFADGSRITQNGQYPTVTEKRLMLTVTAPGAPDDRIPEFSMPHSEGIRP